MIDHIDLILRKLFTEELRLGSGIEIAESQILFASPQDANGPLAGSAQVYLFLQDVRENAAFRDGSYRVMKRPDKMDAAVRRAAVTFDLGYIVACRAADPVQEHKILTAIIAAVYRNQIVPDRYLSEELRMGGTTTVSIQIAQADHPANADVRGVWRSLGGPSCAIAGLVVTAAFNPYETRFVRLVKQALLGVSAAADGSLRPQELRQREVCLAGLVVDAESGAPLEGVAIRIEDKPHSAQTDENGMFYFEHIPAGTYKLIVSKPSYSDTASVDVTVPAAGRPDLVEPVFVRMKASGLILSQGSGPPGHVRTAGRIRYEDGRSAKYAVVRIGDSNSITDGEGRFEIWHVPGKNELEVEIPSRPQVPVEAGMDVEVPWQVVGATEPGEKVEGPSQTGKKARKG